MKEAFFLYAGKRISGKGIVYEYLVIDNLDVNNGKRGEYLKKWRVEKPMWKASIGSIFNVKFTSETTVYYNAKSLVKAWWKNQEDLVLWRSQSTAAEMHLSLQKSPDMGKLEDLLTPVKKMYRETSYTERRLILAEMIRIITS